MFDLAFKGNTAALRAVLSTQPASAVNAHSPDRGASLLYTAARWGHAETVRMLAEEFHAILDFANKENGSTALHGAAFGGHAAIVQYLISRGCTVGLKNGYGETALDNAKAPAAGVSKAASKATVAAFSTSSPAPAFVPAPVATAAPSPPPTAASLSAMTVAELRSLAQSKGLSTVGTKPTLISRLLGEEGAEPPLKKATVEPSVVAAPLPSSPPSSPSATPAPSVAVPTATTVVAPVVPSSPPPPPTVTLTVPVPSSPPPVVVTAASTTEPPPASPSVPVAGLCSPTHPAWIETLRSAPEAVLTEVVPNTQEFWDLEERVMAWNQGRNDDYVSNRIKKKKKPLTFIVKRAWKVSNPVLEKAFDDMKKALIAQYGEAATRVRVAFHGTKEANIPSILRTSLLRFQHPLNPCTTQADDGYFGTNRKGVYVSRYFDYTLKYCNGLNPLDDGDVAKTIMFRCLPGKVAHIEKLSMGIDPTVGYNSHSSPNNLEWYLFDERQLCPEYVLEIRAHVDTRTAADDE